MDFEFIVELMLLLGVVWIVWRLGFVVWRYVVFEGGGLGWCGGGECL